MTHKILVALTLSSCLAGCGLLEAAPDTSTPASAKAGKAGKGIGALSRSKAPGRLERRVGDFFVHRFSGSFREQPLEMREEVLSKDKKTIVIQYTFDDGKKVTVLRVARNAKSDVAEKVVKLVDKEEQPASLADLEAFMGQTVYAADSNEGLIDAEKSTCLVGGQELDCESKQYSVVVGEQLATMRVTSSHGVPGRDIAGEIKTEDGSILYRAELLEAGHRRPAAGGASVASK